QYLDDYEISQITTIVFSLRTSRDILISARFKGESLEDRVRFFGLNVNNFRDQIGKSTVRVYGGGPGEEGIARESLLQSAFPLLCEGLSEAEHQSYNWRRNDHSLVFRFQNKQLLLNLDEDGHW